MAAAGIGLAAINSLLEVDEDQVVQRMLDRGRADDTEETIRTRLEVYREQTEPLVDFYKTAGKLSVVDADGDVEDVYRRLKDATGVATS